MGLEKYFSVGKRVVTAVGLVATLSACETLLEVPKQAAEKMVRMTYIISTLPSEIIIPKEPSINGCIETPKEKVCKLYLEKNTPEFGEEKYFGVLKIKKGSTIFFRDEYLELILAYWDEDQITRGWDEDDEDKPIRDEEKYLIVVVYGGKNSEEFIDPRFGNNAFSYDGFLKYFDKPRANTLDTSDNQIARAKKMKFLTTPQIEKFREELHERIGIALKLADEQLSKSNE